MDWIRLWARGGRLVKIRIFFDSYTGNLGLTPYFLDIVGDWSPDPRVGKACVGNLFFKSLVRFF